MLKPQTTLEKQMELMIDFRAYLLHLEWEEDFSFTEEDREELKNHLIAFNIWKDESNNKKQNNTDSVTTVRG